MKPGSERAALNKKTLDVIQRVSPRIRISGFESPVIYPFKIGKIFGMAYNLGENKIQKVWHIYQNESCHQISSFGAHHDSAREIKLMSAFP